MRNGLFALTLTLLFAFAPAAQVSATTPPAPRDDWSAVRALPAGEKVSVRTKDGDRLKGRFDSATETDISFKVDGRGVTLRRDSVGRVEVGRRNRVLGALVCAGVGGGAGIGAGFALVGASDHFGMSTIPTGAFVGAGIGAALGAAAGFGTSYETVYESR